MRVRESTLGLASYTALIVIIALNTSGGALSTWLNMDRSMLYYVLPLSLIFLAAAIRVGLAIKYRHLMGRNIGDGERDIDLSETGTMVWIGITLTAFFALVAAAEPLKNSQIRLEPIIFFVIISFVAFNASNSLKSYKFHFWQQQLGEILEGVARLSFLSAIGVTAWQAEFGPIFLWVVTVIIFASWLADYVARFVLWRNHFRDL